MNKEITIIKNVRGYQDENGVAQLNLEDVSRGLGFTFIATSGNEVIRWNRVRNYLQEFSFDTSGEKDKLPEYIPENIFYKLCFKAKNEVARKFQDIVTDEVLPSIRKNGMYATDELLNNPDLAIKVFEQLKQEREEKKKLQLENAKQKKVLEDQKSKVLFANSVETAKTSILVGELAKIIKQNGHDIGQVYFISKFLKK